MPPSLLRRRMFSFRGDKAERKESVVRSSAWPAAPSNATDLNDNDVSFMSNGDSLKANDKGSAVKKEPKRSVTPCGDVRQEGVAKQVKEGTDIFRCESSDRADDALIKAMRNDTVERLSSRTDHDEIGLQDYSISSGAVNVLPSMGALEETLFTDTNTESMIRLVRRLHEEDEEIDVCALEEDTLYYHQGSAAVDTHGLLKAATASKMADFEVELQAISKALHDAVEKGIQDTSVKERLMDLENRVQQLATTVTISRTDQENQVLAMRDMCEALRNEWEGVLKSHRILGQRYGELVRRLNSVEANVSSNHVDNGTKHPRVVLGDLVALLLKNIAVPLLTAVMTQQYISRRRHRH